MAMGKAIVASRLDQIAEILKHDETAYLVTPGNAEELAAAISHLASQPVKRDALGTSARRTAVERHSWSQNAAHALENL
jgi:glycosyltransferase involved in cell wall biosynthesis